MKPISIRTFGAAILLGSIAAFAPIASADSTVVTSTGTISEFSPSALVIRSETSPAPLRYTVSKDVTYVDESGAPVSVETVKSGLPVSVSYVREGDHMIVRKVIVQRHTTTTSTAVAPVVEQHATTTTTTAAPVIEQRQPSVTTTPVVTEHHKTTTTTTKTKKDKDEDDD